MDGCTWYSVGDFVRWREKRLNDDVERGPGRVEAVRDWNGRQRLELATRTGRYFCFAGEVELDDEKTHSASK